MMVKVVYLRDHTLFISFSLIFPLDEKSCSKKHMSVPPTSFTAQVCTLEKIFGTFVVDSNLFFLELVNHTVGKNMKHFCHDALCYLSTSMHATVKE